jgi:putative glutamine amidotransferase
VSTPFPAGKGGPRLHIGVSACFFHADSKRAIFKGKTLLYMEETMVRWMMSAGAIPVLIPRPAHGLTPTDLLGSVDGLVLQGGSDLSPTHYTETPARPEWAGDHARDVYEMDLVRAAMALDVPVLGICRGLQLINVALGGSLWQDIATMHPGHRVHRDWEIYDRLTHDLSLVPDSWLAARYPGVRRARVNSVHHQGVKILGKGLVVEATASDDGLVEAFRYEPGPKTGAARTPFVHAVQWHPEFHDPSDAVLLPADPLLQAFLAEVAARRTDAT